MAEIFTKTATKQPSEWNHKVQYWERQQEIHKWPERKRWIWDITKEWHREDKPVTILL